MITMNARTRRKLRGWFIRYAPAEIAGTATALLGYWAAYWATNDMALAAITATITENLGYYSIAAHREIKHHWRAHAHMAGMRRIRFTGTRSLRNLAIEFGPAECIDTLLVRPALFYLLPIALSSHHGIAVLSAKLLADAVFYTCAIAAYELNKKLLAKRVIIHTEEVQPNASKTS
jgi:hypothetical protein